jgi:hypothetical protein
MNRNNMLVVLVFLVLDAIFGTTNLEEIITRRGIKGTVTDIL